MNDPIASPHRRRWRHRGLACLTLWPALVLADAPGPWAIDKSTLRLGYETVELPSNEKMGLLGTSYLIEVSPGLCLGPAVYSAVSGQRGGLFVVGAEAALCTTLFGPLSLQAGVFVGGGGGGAAPVGGGLMWRPHADLLWNFGHFRAGVSVSSVYFPSGLIHSQQVGVVFEADTSLGYLAPGTVPRSGMDLDGIGIDRFLAVGGAYRPRAGSVGISGTPLGDTIAYVGARAEHALTPYLYAGLEANGAASGGADGYAEFLGTLGAQYTQQHFALGGRLALGMGGGGDIPTGGGLLVKAALDASVRLSQDISLNFEGGWARAPQGSFSAPFGSLALVWDLAPLPGQPTRLVRQEFAAGIETVRDAARKNGPPQTFDSVSFKFNRYISESLYLSGQVQSAYAGDAGAFAVGLFGIGGKWHVSEYWHLGAEMLAGAAGGGGMDTGKGAVVKPMVYAEADLSRAVSLRLGAGRLAAIDGALDSPVVELSMVFPFDVLARR